VAAARKLTVRLYWMLRTNTAYPETIRVESSSRVALVGGSFRQPSIRPCTQLISSRFLIANPTDVIVRSAQTILRS